METETANNFLLQSYEENRHSFEQIDCFKNETDEVRTLSLILCAVCTAVLVGQLIVTPMWKFISFYTNWMLILTVVYCVLSVHLSTNENARSLDLLMVHHIL